MKTLKTLFMVCGGIALLLVLILLFMPNDGSTESDMSDPSATPAGEYYDNEAQTGEQGSVKHIGAAEFKKLVADYQSSKNAYIGATPCVVDFYAEWCGPCKQLSPILDRMARKYAGKVTFYKVDIDQAPEVSNTYGIQSIPTLFFCSNGSIEIQTGFPDEEQLEEMIIGM